MGIHGLYKFLAPRCPPQRVLASALCGRTLAVDANIYVHKWAHVRVVGSAGREINHLQGMLSMIARMLRAGVKPIFVFDGAPPRAKLAALAARKRTIGADVWRDCRRLLELAGVAAYDAPCEAETAAAAAVAAGIAYGTVSEDSDCVAYPHGRLLRIGASVDTEFAEYEHDAIARCFGLESDELTTACALAGSDYGSGVMSLANAVAATCRQREDALRSSAGSCARDALEIFSLRTVDCAVIARDVAHAVARERRPDPHALAEFLTSCGLAPTRISSAVREIAAANSPRGEFVIAGYPDCGLYRRAIALAMGAGVDFAARECTREEWPECVRALNGALGTAHVTSPYVYETVDGAKIFVGGCDNFESLLARGVSAGGGVGVSAGCERGRACGAPDTTSAQHVR